MYGILPPLPTVTCFSFMGGVQNIQRGMTPRIFGRSYAIEGELNVPEGGAEGVIVANADFTGGYALWVDERGLLHRTYSLLGVEFYRQVSSEPLPTGDVTVKALFEIDQPKPGSGGKVVFDLKPAHLAAEMELHQHAAVQAVAAGAARQGRTDRPLRLVRPTSPSPAAPPDSERR
jgi:hypothetical protein